MFAGLNGAASARPDGSDMLYGGAGTDISRNNLGDETATGHARDADVIVGDNANIYRLVGINGVAGNGYLTFNYDTYSGDLRIIPRAVEYLDYSVGGPDLNPYAITRDQGGADEIHGESGDDVIYGLTGSDVIFGDGQDDDIIGGWGHDWISAGTGSDGVIGDDGRIMTSRNSTLFGEELHGIAALAQVDVILLTSQFDALRALINVNGQLMKTVNLTPFSSNPANENDRYWRAQQANDIIYGGWGDDFLHGGYGDDAMSGAEALGIADDPRDSRMNQISFDTPYNPGNALAYNPTAGEGDPLLPFFNPADPRSQFNVGGLNFFLNFNPNEGLVDPRSTNGYTTDGDDRIFGDIGNEVIISGTGRDQVYGGYGNDYLNADDDQSGNNNRPNEDNTYEDFVLGGAGEDILIANSIGDRLIDWGGEFNSYYTPFQSVGEPTVINDYSPQLISYLMAMGKADGSDQTRAKDIAGAAGVFLDKLYVAGEPFGELGIVVSNDTKEFAKQYGPNRFPGRGATPADIANPQVTPIPVGAQLAPSPAGNFGDKLPGVYVAGSASATTLVSPTRVLPDPNSGATFVGNSGFLQAVGTPPIVIPSAQSNLTGAVRPGYASLIGPAVQSEIIIDVTNPSDDGTAVQTFIYNSQTGEFDETAVPQQPLANVPEGVLLELRDEDGQLFAYVDANGGLWIIDDVFENPDNVGDSEDDDWIYSGEVSNIGGLIALAGSIVPAALPNARPKTTIVRDA
jgi:Ca2+-binding RTX toxin-like protein